LSETENGRGQVVAGNGIAHLLLGETPKDTNGAKAIVDPTVIAARRSFMMYLFYLMLNYYFEARLSSSFAAAR